jgi:DNA-directed RNA polymerase beta' subunit
MAQIRSVSFAPLSPEQISRLYVPVNRAFTRGGDAKGTPYDPLLGVLEHGEKCHTCGEDSSICPGHFGYIQLPKPYFNPIYIKIVVSILRCVCLQCAKPLIPEERARVQGILSAKGNIRLKTYKKKCEAVGSCPFCGKKVLKIMERPGMDYLEMEDKDKKVAKKTETDSRRIVAEEVYNILIRISNATMTLLGFNNEMTKHPDIISANYDNYLNLEHPHQIRPEAFLFTNFPVVPPSARPWVTRGGERCDDDITERYHALVKGVKRIVEPQQTKRGGGKRGNAKEPQDNIFRDICTLFDNSKGGKDNANDRKHKGLNERLSGKEGHIQTNAAGKRVDFSGRCVIVSGGHLMDIDEIGIPEYISQILTVPETVTPWNIAYFTHLLQEGKINTVIRGGAMINVKRVTRDLTRPFVVRGVDGLIVKDTVERHLQNGDVGLFNRQPTLRVESMQGVRVKIMKGEYVWRIPLAISKAFNADKQI